MKESVEFTRPCVFISSTRKDLDEYRRSAKSIIDQAGLASETQEAFTADTEPPLDFCLEKVSRCHLLIVIVAHRYGSIPVHPLNPDRKSITQLEVEAAISKKIGILAFVVDPQVGWPNEHKDSWKMMEFLGTPERVDSDALQLIEEIKHDEKGLRDFKKMLQENVGTLKHFTGVHDFGLSLSMALNDWRLKNLHRFPGIKKHESSLGYLKWLEKSCSSIEIRGLVTGSNKAHRFDIDKLYVPLSTAQPIKQFRPEILSVFDQLETDDAQNLFQAAKHARLVIIGDPGAGKTTFLRRIAFELSRALLSDDFDRMEKNIGFRSNKIPLFVRLADLAEFISQSDKDNAYATSQSCFFDFLEKQIDNHRWDLSVGYFRTACEEGKVLLLLDGLDEAPDAGSRAGISELIGNFLHSYDKCHVMISSRPLAYEGKAVLADFYCVTIGSLSDGQISFFLHQWTRSMLDNDPQKSDVLQKELVEAIQSRTEIRRLARNPVMLTVLAVLHWNFKKMPEQRTDLYASIIHWLLQSREQRPRRLTVENCERVLQQLALGMHLFERGRQIQVGMRTAAEMIASRFEGNEEDALRAAQRFISDEQIDSGIIVSRGNNVSFWHLTFQEYLAAREIGGKVESKQREILFRPEFLNKPEFRETIRLYGGILYSQGVDKLDKFLEDLVQYSKKSGELRSQAHCIGIIGNILWDMAPVKYGFVNETYARMKQNTMRVFSKEESSNMVPKDRLEVAVALGQVGDPRFSSGRVEMVKIPPAKLVMDLEGKSVEIPVQEFEISRYPVTVDQFREFMNAGGYYKQKYWERGGWGEFEKPHEWEEQLRESNCPVVGISWFEAKAWCAWAGFDLPTINQWKVAARKEPGTAPAKKNWSRIAQLLPTNQEEPFISFRKQLAKPFPVGLFPEHAGTYGLDDIDINVFEYVLDSEPPEGFRSAEVLSSEGGNDEYGKYGRIGKAAANIKGNCFKGIVQEASQRSARGKWIGFRPVRSCPRSAVNRVRIDSWGQKPAFKMSIAE